MRQRILFNLSIAWEAILANKLRSFLTALGIIFGVSAVIAMLAIGNGAQQEILEQIKLVGVNNIVIKSIIPKENEEESQDLSGSDNKNKNNFSLGLTLADAESVRKNVPTVALVSPEIIIERNIIKDNLQRSAKVIGVEPSFFEMYNFKLSSGAMFSQNHLEYGKQVCIIGTGISTKFFSGENPIGKRIKCGKNWLKIIGVLESKSISESTGTSDLGIRDYNMDIYTPIKTILMRYKNRTLVTQAAIQKAIEDSDEEEDKSNKKTVNYHQLDRLVVQVKETETLSQTADIISRMLNRRHFEEVDFEITIPELLLKQQQRTKDIFNWVLFIIAAISLLVGGIGIMNIMLASVLERIKEIGLRLSIGAKKVDIILQFMLEAVLISVSGGIIGIILGVSMSYSIANFAEIPTIISLNSILISFLVSVFVGLIFGVFPARRAAQQDPITSLRYE